jgi:hypothetical protein
MTLEELQKQVLQLDISDRWHLVQSMLTSIQQEIQLSHSPHSTVNSLPELDSWTQSLIGVIHLEDNHLTESYESYLEEKYR